MTHDGLQRERSALAITPTERRYCLFGWDSSSAGCYREAVYDLTDPWWFMSQGAVIAGPRCGYHAESDFLAVLREAYQRAEEALTDADASPADVREPGEAPEHAYGEGASDDSSGFPAPTALREAS